MTAEEIRAKMANPGYTKWHDGTERTQVLVEIAAQLAELNETLRGFAGGYLPVGLCATNDDIPVRIKE